MHGFSKWLLVESEMTELIAGALANYLDQNALNVLADWFEESGDPMGDYIRACLGFLGRNAEHPERQQAYQLMRQAAERLHQQFAAAGMSADIGESDFHFVGPPPSGKRPVRYRVIGTQVEMRVSTNPVRWEPVDLQNLPEIVAKAVLWLRLREYTVSAIEGPDPAQRAGLVQVRRHLLDLDAILTRYQRNCPSMRNQMDTIEAILRRIEYYLDSHEQLAFEPDDIARARWVLRHVPVITRCELDRDDIVQRLTQILQQISGNNPAT